MKRKTYFGIMHVYRFKGNFIDDEWFIHFSFKSSYQGQDDCSQHDEDYSKPFTRSFVSDSEAFVFAEDMTDGPESATVWKEMGGNWHAWDYENNTWVYDPVVSSEL